MIDKQQTSPDILILGLGPGDPNLLTRRAWDVINSAEEIYLRTNQHPTVDGFPPDLRIHSFDPYYQTEDSLRMSISGLRMKLLPWDKMPLV